MSWRATINIKGVIETLEFTSRKLSPMVKPLALTPLLLLLGSHVAAQAAGCYWTGAYNRLLWTCYSPKNLTPFLTAVTPDCDTQFCERGDYEIGKGGGPCGGGYPGKDWDSHRQFILKTYPSRSMPEGTTKALLPPRCSRAELWVSNIS